MRQEDGETVSLVVDAGWIRCGGRAGPAWNKGAPGRCGAGLEPDQAVHVGDQVGAPEVPLASAIRVGIARDLPASCHSERPDRFHP